MWSGRWRSANGGYAWLLPGTPTEGKACPTKVVAINAGSYPDGRPAFPHTNPGYLRPRIASPETIFPELCTKTPHFCTRFSRNRHIALIYANRGDLRGAGCTIMDNFPGRKSGPDGVQEGHMKGRAFSGVTDCVFFSRGHCWIPGRCLRWERGPGASGVSG
jgi:hypothetical protein